MKNKEINPSGKTIQLHVLLAEDNLLNQEVVTEMLELIGCTYDVVVNGKELLDLMDEVYCDIVLMNCQMPIMDGFEATKEIRRLEYLKDERTPIIALTANAMSIYKNKCLDADMDDYLSKPFNKAQLHEILRKWS